VTSDERRIGNEETPPARGGGRAAGGMAEPAQLVAIRGSAPASRPVKVLAAGVALVLLGLLSELPGLALLVVALHSAENRADAGFPAQVFTGAFLLVSGKLHAVPGVAVIAGKPWARLLGGAVAAVGLALWCAATLFLLLLSADYVGNGNFYARDALFVAGLFLILALYGFILYALARERRHFTDRPMRDA
jgi:hypothetical protein